MFSWNVKLNVNNEFSKNCPNAIINKRFAESKEKHRFSCEINQIQHA